MLRELELVYQNSVHGNSLATLYSCVGDRSPLIILIEDTHRHLFGCFLTTPLKSQKKMSSFTGTGEVRTLQAPPFVTQLFQECCSVDPTIPFLCGTLSRSSSSSCTGFPVHASA